VLTGEETVIDAYCGIGTIPLFLAHAARKVYRGEVVPEAVENSRASPATPETAPFRLAG